MGYRLSKIFTRTGDDGTTGLADGSRVAKDDPRIEAIGTVDELNCALGSVLAIIDLPQIVRSVLTSVQHELFDLGAELSMPGHRLITAEHVTRLERVLDELNATLPPLENFILPSGGPATATCHVARAVSRRAERRVWTLARKEGAPSQAPKYLNRLSDLLFVFARVLARHERGAEILWRQERGVKDEPD